MLPNNKDEFPKCLYLDQMMWIGLAQADGGNPAGARFTASLAAIRAAVDSGKLIVPISLVNLIEAAIPGREDRRENLLSFMIGLSGNKGLAHYEEIRALEIENALRHRFVVGELIPVRERVVRGDLLAALGIALDFSEVPASDRAATEAKFRSPEMFLATFLERAGDREVIRNAVAQESEGAKLLEQLRSESRQVTDRQREVLNLAGLFREPPIETVLLAALGRWDIPLERWVTEVFSKPDEFVPFARSIPFFDVFVGLILAHERNTSRLYSKNDLRDLVWLATAIPYSNVVAGETYWTTLAGPLAAKYKTAVTNKPENIPGLLKTIGCE